MRITLVIVPWAYQHKGKRVQPHLGLGYVAASLEQAGHQVKIIDGGLRRKVIPAEITRDVLADEPDVVGVTCTSDDRFSAITICNEVKAALPRCLVMVGGPHFGYTAEDALAHVSGIDVVVTEEGEDTAVELVEFWRQNRDLAGVRGIAYRGPDGLPVRTPERPLIMELDRYPMAWHLYDLDQYQGIMSAETKTRAVGLISERGCPAKCSFCFISTMRKMRYRSPKLFVDEIEMLHTQYGVPGFNFQDDTWGASRKQCMAICEEIIARRLGDKIRWFCGPRIDSVDRELLGLMQRAGCVALGYGIETGTDRMMAAIRKDTTTQQVRETVKLTGEMGFDYVNLNLMISLPGQTIEDIDQTIEFFQELHGYIPQNKAKQFLIGQPCGIYPGTEMERIAKMEGSLPKDFSWNSPYAYEKAQVFGVMETIPHYENPHLSIEEIFVHLDRVLWKYKARNAMRYLRQARSAGDVLYLTGVAGHHLSLAAKAAVHRVVRFFFPRLGGPTLPREYMQ